MATRTPIIFLVALVCFITTAESRQTRAAERPNFVWILSEDNSKHYLRLYGDELGAAPNIEQLAREGITFHHAFSNAPVCSVARTTLMSGMYAPRIGFQYHRKLKMANLPPGAKLFPAYLREAGYYTTNNSKKDYNVVEGKVWDESSNKASWRNRPAKDTPFFHMQSTGVSHESSLHFPPAQMKVPTKTRPDQVEIAPYHPDTPTFRYTYARYHDRMHAIDAEVGKIVERLEKDGLLDDTIIFYFGDHGGVLPRSKGYVYESGLNVPLVVRVPEKWQKLVHDVGPGTETTGFVSFIDFGPTVLNLAGLDIPESMDGEPFLGAGLSVKALDSRNESFGYADRFDEKYDFCRSLRVGRYKYIRNYQAFYPDALQNNYRYKMLAYAEWRQLYRAGKLNAAQRQFFEARPPEALYDITSDPHEVNNLAGDPKYANVLQKLREQLRQRVKSLPDLSFFPESYMVDQALDDGAEFGRRHAKEIAHLVDIADLALLPFEQAEAKLKAALADKQAWPRYWALIACSCFGKQAESLAGDAKQLLDDPELLVRVRAAEFLGLIGAADPRPALMEVLATSDSPIEALLTMNTIVFFARRQAGIRLQYRSGKNQGRPQASCAAARVPAGRRVSLG